MLLVRVVGSGDASASREGTGVIVAVAEVAVGTAEPTAASVVLPEAVSSV